MIRFNSSNEQVRVELNNNAEYVKFVEPGNPIGSIDILVEDVQVVLYHNVGDTFSSFLRPEEFVNYKEHLSDISRIAIAIKNIAKDDFDRNENM